jgi:TRAP-type C4-dicarboxylate transport system permease small subunit
MVQGLGVAFLTINMILIVGGVILVVLFVTAIWRSMKAHESIAESLQVMAAAQNADKTGE